MVQAIYPHQPPLQPATPLRRASGATGGLCCVFRVITAVAYFFLVVVRSIFCCCQRSPEERALQEIPSDSRDAIRALANHIFYAAQDHDPPVLLSASAKSEIIKVIYTIPIEERQAIVSLLKRTILDSAGCPPYLLRYLVSLAIDIRAPEKEEAIQYALPLIYRDMSIIERGEIIEAMANIHPGDRRVAAALTLLLIPHRLRNDGQQIDRVRILEAVMRIPAGQRINVVNFARRLITSQMHTDDMIQIVEDVAGVNQHARGAYVVGQMRAHHIDINAIRNIHLGVLDAEIDIDEILRNPLAVFDEEEGDQVMGNAPVDDADHRVLMQNGMQVHATGRDDLVKDAIEKLYQHQGHIDRNTLHDAVDAFTVYIAMSEKNNKQKELAYGALVVEKWAAGGFEHLLDRKKFTISGLDISGFELVGRLWIFTDQLEDEKEKINAKEGMIGALADSYNENGTRVCNPGKAQRLVIQVLQGEGRLSGVNVDRVEIPQKVSGVMAVKLFTAVKANQQITDFNVLKEKAEQYLKDNPGVDKAEFRKEIRGYAELQVMDHLPSES